MSETLAREVVGLGEAPNPHEILLDLEVVPCDKGTLVTVQSDVLEAYVCTSMSADREEPLGKCFHPPGVQPLTVNFSRRMYDDGKPESWPLYIASGQPGQTYTEVGNGQYNPLPLMLKGLREGKSIILGPTSRAMREGYVSALLNFAEELFRTYGDKRGVKGTLRVVKDV